MHRHLNSPRQSIVKTISLMGLLAAVCLSLTMPAETASAVEGKSQDAASDAADKPSVPPRNRRIVPRRKGEISFDTILLDMEKDEKFEPEMITKEVKAIEDKTVTIRGFILPSSVFQQVGIKRFVLVRDNQECCFGPGAALYDCIMIKMVGDSSADFSTRPVAVKGKFHVTQKYKNPDGSLMAIYEMDATEVK